MMYAGMPQLSEAERLAALPVLDTRAQLSATEAMDRAELDDISLIKLTSLFGRPVWRIRASDGQWHTVFADTGEIREAFQYEEAQASIQPFLTADARPQLIEALLEPDQWTVGGNYESLRPLYHVALNDSAKTELYMAAATGEVILRTTARTRMLAWAGAIPHWIYFTAIRKHGPFWRQFVIWVSGIGCAVALLGLAVGIWRFSPSRRYSVRNKGRSWSPYVGMMRWHHWGGLTFGVFTFTWVFSGMLSLEPGYVSTGGAPTGAQTMAFAGGELDYKAFAALPALVLASYPDAKEVQVRQVAAQPYYLVARSGAVQELVDDTGRAVEPFASDFLLAAAQEGVTNAKITEQVVLHDYDAYYYDRDRRRPLPILRIKFDDPQQTWLYVDPRSGTIAARYVRSGRIARWLYHGFHSLDFPFLWYSRPAWDIVVIALSLGGILLSAIAVVIGYRRLRDSVLR